jgi:hypothetical protein
MLVRAKETGFYKHLRNPGEEFEYPGKLGSWMERVNKPGRKKEPHEMKKDD